MSEHETEAPGPGELADDPLEREQEGKGYGEDEGEREAALDDDSQ